MARVELERDPVSLPNGARRVDSEDQEGLPDPDLALVGVSDENERFDLSPKEVAPRRLVPREYPDEFGPDAHRGRLSRRKSRYLVL